jgi:Skp family chaperone for outer membrane proteins
MTILRRMIPAVAAAVAVAAAATAAAQAPAFPVATVDLARVFDKATERSDFDVQMSMLQKQIQDELAARQKAFNEDAKKLKDMADPAQAAARAALEDRLRLDEIRLREWVRSKQMEIDREKALAFQKIYRSLRDECAKLAQDEGYQLIMVNDSVREIRTRPANEDQRPQEVQVQEQIGDRKVLFAAKSVDVTEKLILRMNNARQSTSPKPATPAAAPAPADAAK